MNPHNLRDWWTIAKRTKRVYYVTDHLSRTGMGAAYSLYVLYKGQLWKAWPNSDKGAGSYYDERLAKALGFRITKAWRSFYRGGCGYNRTHDIVYSMARHFGGNLEVANAISIEGLGDNG